MDFTPDEVDELITLVEARMKELQAEMNGASYSNQAGLQVEEDLLISILEKLEGQDGGRRRNRKANCKSRKNRKANRKSRKNRKNRKD